MKYMLENHKSIVLAALGVVIAALAFGTVLVANNAFADEGSYIDEERAKEIALEKAGLKSSDVTFTKVKLDKDDGVMTYEVEFYSQDAEYDYDLNASNGEVLGSDIEKFKSSNSANESAGNGAGDSAGADGYIGVNKAKSIALAKAGLSSASWQKAYLDYDDGRRTYELEFRNGDYEYDVEVDAVSGDIVGFDKDYERSSANNGNSNNKNNGGANKSSSPAAPKYYDDDDDDDDDSYDRDDDDDHDDDD